MVSVASLTQFFQNILQRSPSEAELAAWTDLASAHAWTDAQVLTAIVASAEAQTFSAQVIRFYHAAFGRVPDVTGISGWVNQLRDGTATTTGLADGFVNSAEWAARYGGNEVNQTVLKALYINVLGRLPADAEIEAWLATGQSMTEILIGFANSAEFQATMATLINSFLLDAGDIATSSLAVVFDGGSCLCVSKDWTYTLTSDQNVLVGTASNDTFTAINSGQTQTLNAGDNLDGGVSGLNDVLNIYDSGTGTRTYSDVTLTSIETLRLRSDAALAMTFDAAKWTGVETIEVSQTASATDVSFQNLQALVDAKMTDGSGSLALA